MNDLRTLTVGELRELLAAFPDSTPVAFAYPSGDHWRTTLVGDISTAENTPVRYSSYHRMHQVQEEDSTEEPERTIVILR